MNTAENSLTCHVCDGPVPFGHRSHRGLLINSINHLQSTLITSREQLASLRKKGWSKQFPEQRKKDLEAMKALEVHIERDEQLLASLKKINEECYE